MPLRARYFVVITLMFCFSLCLLAAGEAAARVVKPDIPEGQPPLLPVRLGKTGDLKDYYPIDQGAQFTLLGPGTFYFFARADIPEGGIKPDSMRVTLDGLLGFDHQIWNLKMSSSRTSVYETGRTGKPTGGKKISLFIPKGMQTITIQGVSTTGGAAFGRFYYDGPPTPTAAELAEQKRIAEKANRPVWKFASNSRMDVIYDDNISRISDDTIETLESGTRPEKFAIEKVDDMIIGLTVQCEASRPLLLNQKTRFRVRYKRWDYAVNSIKGNQEINLRVRQNTTRYNYFESTYTYAPNGYIKELADRPPFTSMTVDREYLHFKSTRNAFALGYVHRVKKWWIMKVFGGRTLRFYNRPFLENDLWEWNGKVETDLKYGRFTTNLRYAYAYDEARGYDEVGETLENSNNDGDGSYEKDSYRIKLSYRPRKAPYRPGEVVSGMDSALAPLRKLGSWIDQGLIKVKTNSVYIHFKYDRQFYTSERPLDVDPLHVGRLDISNQVQFVWTSKAVWNKVKLESGVRYTVRTADSPAGNIGEDDPSDEKDYTGTRYWFAFSRPLW